MNVYIREIIESIAAVFSNGNIKFVLVTLTSQATMVCTLGKSTDTQLHTHTQTYTIVPFNILLECQRCILDTFISSSSKDG